VLVHTISVTSEAASLSSALSANRPCVQATATDRAPCSRSRSSSSNTVVPREISSSRMITSRPATSPMMAGMTTCESLIRSFAPAATGTPSLRANAAALLAWPRSGETTTARDRSRLRKCAANSRSACRWSTGTEKNPCTCGECRVIVRTRLTPAVTSRSATRRPAMEILGSSFLSDRAYAKCGITAVTRAAEAPRAASAMRSSSTRCSCTGRTSGWMRNTSRSRQLACSWTSRQSLANRVSRTGCCLTARNSQISAVSAG
jgi:hypothetical protein